MIMMLIRTLLWGAAILAAALAFVFLKDSTGGVSVELNGRQYGPFAPLEFVGLVFVLALLIWLLVKIFSFLVALARFFAGDETALSRFWNRARERRGFDALSQGLIAMAEGDGKTAMLRARKAERLLARPGLTRLVVAQAAEAAGESAVARRYYKSLASEPDTAFVGVRGLLSDALKKGERERALKLARHAFSLKPKDGEVLTTLFGLQSGAEDWSGARETLLASVHAKAMTKDVAARREAVLLLAQARDVEDEGLRRDLTMEANRKSPALVPAAADAARLLAADGQQKRARGVLKEAWRQGPHPDIAAAFAALEPEETPSARRRRFKELTSILPDHPETRMLSAELALADKDWDAARAALGDLADGPSSARALSIMAAVEKGAGADEAVVRGWLAKAVSAPRGPQWVCTACGAQHGEWAPTCGACDAIDTLEWKDAGGAENAFDANAAMAPLVADVEESAIAEAPARPGPEGERKAAEA